MGNRVTETAAKRKIVVFISLYLFLFFISVYWLSSSDVMVYDTDASTARYEATKSIVERFDLSIPEGLGFKGIDGREYSWYGIGQSLLAVPFYVVGKIIGTPESAVSMMNQIIGAAVAVVVFIFVLSLGYSKRVSLFVSVIYGLGTIAWPLAKQPFDHTIETFFILLAVFFMYYYGVNKRGVYLLLSAFAVGFAFITRPTSILVVPALCMLNILYDMKESDLKMIKGKIVRDIVLFSLAFVPFLCVSLWYNYYRFGSIFETGFSMVSHSTGIHLFSGTSFLTGLSGLLISPGKGYFYYSPITILFFFAIKSFLKRHRELSISFIIMMISYLVFFSKYVFWHGDWAWGPRYLLALTPFFIIPTAEIISSDTWRKKKLRRGALYSILMLSLFIQIAAVSVDYSKHLTRLRFEENIKFTVMQSQGLQPTVVPPPETYFDWKRAPILAQFKYIHEIYNNIKNYQYAKPIAGETIPEKMRAAPFYNIYDFWWMYKYILEGSYSGFIVAVLLILVAICCVSRIWKYAK